MQLLTQKLMCPGGKTRVDVATYLALFPLASLIQMAYYIWTDVFGKDIGESRFIS